MLEKPTLSDNQIISALQSGYGLSVQALGFLPIGNDATAWVYRVETSDGASYFLKAKSVQPTEPSLSVPRLLNDSGIRQVIAPLPSLNGTLWVKADSFTLILYPFVDGTNAMGQGMTPSQWVEFGHVLKRIHTLALPPSQIEGMVVESFVSKFRETVREVQKLIDKGVPADPIQQELTQFWQSRQDEIDYLVARTEVLGQICRARAPDLVICHADIHTANVLVTPEAEFFIVDWDETLMAPIERDLMFVGGKVIDEPNSRPYEKPEESVGLDAAELFYQGYGKIETDPAIFAYYCYEWVVQEIGDFGERIFLMGDLGEETKRAALSGFKQLFDPGDVVEGAYQADAKI